MSGKETTKEFWKRTPLNTLMNIIRTLVMSVVGIFLVPYYIDNLGLSAYGIIPLATTITSYVMIVSDSLTTACARYTVLSIHNDDHVSETINTAFFGILRGCIILIPVIIAISILAPTVFNIDENGAAEVQIMFFLILLSSLIIASTSSLLSVFNAFNKLYLIYLARMGNTIIQVGLIFLMFTAGTPSLIEVGASYLIASVAYLSIIIALAKRCYPPLKIKHRDYNKTIFKQMGTLGIWSVIFKFGNMLYIQASLVLINIFLGSEAGGGFAIISSLISMVHTACFSVTTSFEPLVFNDYAKDNLDELKRILKCGIKFIAIIFALPVAFIIVLSPEIITAWVGQQYTYLAILASIAMISDVIYCCNTVLESVPVAFARVKTIAILTLTFGMCNVVSATIALAIGCNLNTIMWIWLFWTIVFTCASMMYSECLLKTKRFFLLKPAVLGTILSFILAFIIKTVTDIIPIPGNWFALIPAIFIMMALYLPFGFMLMSKNEKTMIASIMPNVIKKIITKFI